MTYKNPFRTIQSALRLILTLFILMIQPSLAKAKITAISAGAVVDPESRTIRKNDTILVENVVIKVIGVNTAIPADADIIDLSKQTVLPGLMDAHTHLLASLDPKWDLGSFWTMALHRREGYRAILGAKHAKEVLEAGFTTV